MITRIRITFRKSNKEPYKSHTFDIELRHVAIIGAYIEGSLISVPRDAMFYRATQNISLQYAW